MTQRISISLLFAVSVLTACSPGIKTRPGMIQSVNNNAQFDDAVALLIDGNVKAARKMLSVMVKRDPADHRTAALFATLDADPAVVLGTRSFTYKVQAGDQLTALAQRFLSDRLKFYLLARYNGMTVPKAIVAGQVLRIPGDAPPPRIVRPTQPEPTREPVAVAPKSPVDHAPSAAAIHRAIQLRGAGLAALNTGNVNRAVMLLRQAAALDRTSPAVKKDLARAQRIQATVEARR
jgi:LysM repeat protein